MGNMLTHDMRTDTTKPFSPSLRGWRGEQKDDTKMAIASSATQKRYGLLGKG